MPFSTIQVTFQDDFLVQIDQIASKESRTRSELVSSAVKLYIDRKKEFENIFKTGKQIGSTLEIAEEDVMNEIKEYRIERTFST